jgi:O-antigen ligase
MENIYNSLKIVFQNLIKESTNNNSFILVLLVLITIPLSNVVNSVAVGLFFLIAVFKTKRENITFDLHLVLSLLLYALMAISYFWSIDPNSTTNALSKEIPLLLIPLAFIIINPFTLKQKGSILQYYSYAIFVFVLYYLIRAVIRYCIFKDARVFFYHGENEIDYGLVPKLLNAIHMSVFVAVAFFWFLSKAIKSKTDTIISATLFGFILLLSSKNIILIVLLLVLIYAFVFSKTAHKMRLRNLVFFGLLIGVIFSIGRIKHRFQVEFQSNTSRSLNANVIEGVPQGVHYVSIKEAWTNRSFTPNDYFPGTAFRVYQFRIFSELIKENHVFMTGFGLNASLPKIKEKAIQYNLFMGDAKSEGYQTKNFHNQYVQNFADLGLFGFLILTALLIINLKNAIYLKDFAHIAFAILMISLFLTESFLWRQRGVVFFVMMFCLFNSGIKIIYSKSK